MDLLGLLKAGTDEVDKARRELGLRIEKCPRGAAAFTVVYCQVGGYTGCPAKLFTLGYLFFCLLLLMQIAKSGTFLKNSGNLLHDRHKNFENRFITI